MTRQVRYGQEYDYEFPDTMPSKETGWATFIPLRSPQFKIHTTEGLANSAMAQRSYSESYAKYQLVDGVWIIRFEYHPAKTCNYCGNEFTKNAWGGAERHAPLSEGPRWNKLPICNSCFKYQKAQRSRELIEKRELAQLAQLQAKYN